MVEMTTIAIDNDVYSKLKCINEVEDKDFSEIIREALEGKTIAL